MVISLLKGAQRRRIATTICHLHHFNSPAMVKQRGSAASGRGESKDVKGKKRRAESALENETGEDEFFLASDQEEKDVEDDDDIEETAQQKRLRLGKLLYYRHCCLFGICFTIACLGTLLTFICNVAAKAYIARMRQDDPRGGRHSCYVW